MNTEWRLLRADEIEIRTGQKTKDGTQQRLLLYKDARCDMARLDEQFGQYGWQRDHKDIHGVSYCGVGLWSSEHGCWIWKWDAGDNTNDDPKIATKGEASDSFKRACVCWGLGRELYTAPQIWVDANIDPRKLKVSCIEYDEKKREISYIAISDNKGAVIFSKGTRKSATETATNVELIKPAQPAPAAPKIPSSSVTPQPEENPVEPPQIVLTEREQTEYEDAMAKMDFAQSRSQLVDIFTMYKDATFASLLLLHGNKICAKKGWRVS